MSFQVSPDSVQSAAQNLTNIHSTLEDASSRVAAPTTGVAAAAEDQVSAGVAALFNSFGQEYQVLSAQAQSFHAQFVNQLSAGAGAYLSTEIANAEQAVASSRGFAGSGTAGRGRRCRAAALPRPSPRAVALRSRLRSRSSAGSGAGTGGPDLGRCRGRDRGLPLGGLAGGTPVGSLLGGLGGASLVPSLNGVVTALENGSALSLLSGPIGTGLQTLSRIFRMHLAMYVPHQRLYIEFVVAEIGAVPSLAPLAQHVDDWRELPALRG